MARPHKKKSDNWRPPCVELASYGYRWRKRGHPAVKLCDPDATRAEVWAAYEQLIKGGADDETTSGLIDKYFKSHQFTGLKSATQRDYRQYSVRIKAVFGAMLPDTITSPHVQLFLDARGEKHPTAANHEKAFLSLVLNWGRARGYVAAPNPCDPVRSIKTKPGGRYVDDWEYKAFHAYLLKTAPMLAHAMEIAYLCAARRQDIAALTRADIREQGLYIMQAKTGKKQIKQWTPRLRAAVNAALAIKHKRDSLHILRNRSGDGYTPSGITSGWGKSQRQAIIDGVIKQRFRFHDLKIKGVSDYDGDRQMFSGHKNRSMSERYNRTADIVGIVDRD